MDTNHHLGQEQIIIAVVDESELPPHLQEHLMKCSECMEQKEQLEKELSLAGELAKRSVPAFSKRIVLQKPGLLKSPFLSWNWRYALGTGMAAVLFIIVISYSSIFRGEPEVSVASITQEMWKDEHLLREISSLEENPLPQALEDLSSERTNGIDDEFIRFIVPVDTNQTKTDDQQKRGAGQC